MDGGKGEKRNPKRVRKGERGSSKVCTQIASSARSVPAQQARQLAVLRWAQEFILSSIIKGR